jgi:hypothetical protein
LINLQAAPSFEAFGRYLGAVNSCSGRRPPERVLSSLGKSADVIARAGSAEGARLMQEATDAARELGIFGAPTFAVGTEIFWGDDRLEEAIVFATRLAR